MPTPTQQSTETPPPAWLAREHAALERLYIVRGQLDYLRAQRSPESPAQSQQVHHEMLATLERSYAHATRDYEALRAQRRLASSKSAAPSERSAWDRPVGGALLFSLVIGTAVIAWRWRQRVVR